MPLGPPKPEPFRISLALSGRFARLSGDYNPIHLDPVRARRSHFGGTVVHGVHAFLLALDRWAGLHGKAFALQSARVKFHAAIPTGSRVEWDASEERGKLVMQLRARNVLAQRVTLRYRDCAPGKPERVPAAPRPLAEPDALTFAQSVERSGEVEPGMDADLAARLLPNLRRWMPMRQLAAILATSQIVGMRCPGLNSLFMALDADFPPRAGRGADARLSYRVTETDERYSMVTIEIHSAPLSGRLQAMFRPPPVSQESFPMLCARLESDEFRGQRALILGGSRGLGEIAAKLIAAGGGEAWISYAAGKADALAIAGEIKAQGRVARVFRFDALHPPETLPDGLDGAPHPTHLYFFATPAIAFNKTGIWDSALFGRFCEYYVAGLARSIRAVRSWWPAAPLLVYYPSTAFLEEPTPGAAEYAAAKNAGEALCRFLEAGNPDLRFYIERLPRMHTDQTNAPGLDATEMPPAAEALLRSLRGFGRFCPCYNFSDLSSLPPQGLERRRQRPPRPAP